MTGNGDDSDAHCNTHADAQVNSSGIPPSLSHKAIPFFSPSLNILLASMKKRNPVYFLPNQLETNTKFDMKKKLAGKKSGGLKKRMGERVRWRIK